MDYHTLIEKHIGLLLDKAANFGKTGEWDEEVREGLVRRLEILAGQVVYTRKTAAKLLGIKVRALDYCRRYHGLGDIERVRRLTPGGHGQVCWLASELIEWAENHMTPAEP